MEQLDFFPIPNPCRGICRMNERGYCLGCWRRREERFEWLTFSESQKANIIRLALQRKRKAYYQQRCFHQRKPRPNLIVSQPALFLNEDT